MSPHDRPSPAPHAAGRGRAFRRSLLAAALLTPAAAIGQEGRVWDGLYDPAFMPAPLVPEPAAGRPADVAGGVSAAGRSAPVPPAPAPAARRLEVPLLEAVPSPAAPTPPAVRIWVPASPAAGGPPAFDPSAAADADAPPLAALRDLCVVALREKRFERADPRHRTVHQGRTYFFASEDARRAFLANPALFAVAYCGVDPVAYATRGEIVEGTLLRSHAGRFHLFESAENWETFRVDPARFVRR